MILSGQTIRRWCQGANMISPFAERTIEGGMTYGLGPAGYDVRVEFDEYGERECVLIPPNNFILASTIERFEMPSNFLAEVKDKSSWARRGISVFNTVIEPGWRGHLTLEIANHAGHAIRIARGVPIAQIIFYTIDEIVALPYEGGKYQDQGRGPKEAK